MNAKLRIMVKAIEIRLNNGESLNNIIASYPALTLEEIKEIKSQFAKGGE